MEPAALTGQKKVEQAGAIFKMIPRYLTAQRDQDDAFDISDKVWSFTVWSNSMKIIFSVTSDGV